MLAGHQVIVDDRPGGYSACGCRSVCVVKAAVEEALNFVGRPPSDSTSPPEPGSLRLSPGPFEVATSDPPVSLLGIPALKPGRY